MDFYLRRKVSIQCIHFQYGQPNGQSEAEAVEKLTNYYGLEKSVVQLGFPLMKRKEELLGRNTFFVLAASSLGVTPARIALGIHSGSPYYDCSRLFIEDCQRVLDGYFQGIVRLEAPFLDFGKRDIVRYCKTNNVPIQLTYSCQTQNYPPCGKCTSCLDRQQIVGC